LKPPTFLKPGDVVDIKVTGLGTLTNKVATLDAENYVAAKLNDSHLDTYNLDITCGGIGLRQINNKLLNIAESGVEAGEPIIYVHGLGGTSEYWQPLISTLHLDSTYKNVLFDLEGHGLSPTAATSIVTISSYAADLERILTKPSIVIAHSMGCLVAIAFASSHPELVKKLILLGPPPNPLPQAGSENSIKRAAAVREKGMLHSGVAAAVANDGTSKKTKENTPLALSAVRQFLLSQDPEGYAKGCTALAGATETLDVSKLQMPVLIVTGDEDGVCKPKNAEIYKTKLKDCKVVVLEGVGHWHVTEDVKGVSAAVKAFL
jgi:pimeloyl-ACP methyl ester carboxylesterase